SASSNNSSSNGVSDTNGVSSTSPFESGSPTSVANSGSNSSNPTSAHTGTPIAPIIGGVLGALIIVALVVSVFLCRRRRHRRSGLSLNDPSGPDSMTPFTQLADAPMLAPQSKARTFLAQPPSDPTANASSDSDTLLPHTQMKEGGPTSTAGSGPLQSRRLIQLQEENLAMRTRIADLQVQLDPAPSDEPLPGYRPTSRFPPPSTPR
ncbi:hypothetical protein DXG01_006225, partial [Tephrocybe rancida]